MNRHLMSHILLAMALGFPLLLVTACAQEPKPKPLLEPLKPTTGVMLRQFQAESNSLRSELGALKISAAKQIADLRAAQREAKTLRQHESALAQQLDSVKTENAALRDERDLLIRKVAQLENQTSVIPQLRQQVAQLRATQDSLNHMAVSIKTLTADLDKIKDSVKHQQARGEESVSLDKTATTTMTVKPGDTLWNISQRFGTTVDTIRLMNDLNGDLIFVGERLIVPKPLSTTQELDALPPPTVQDHPVSEAKGPQ